jgi:hypothetical protein
MLKPQFRLRKQFGNLQELRFLQLLVIATYLAVAGCSDESSKQRISDNLSNLPEAGHREFSFIEYLKERHGIKQGEKPAEGDLWSFFLEYDRSIYDAKRLTSVYQVFEDHTNTPAAISSEVIPHPVLQNNLTITQPRFGGPPLRMISSLFEVSQANVRQRLLYLEASFVWEEQQWKELHFKVQEVPQKTPESE